MTPKDRKASATAGAFLISIILELVGEPLGSGSWLRFIQTNWHVAPVVLEAMQLGWHRTFHRPELQRHSAVGCFGARPPDDCIDGAMSCNFEHRAIRI